MDRPQKETLVTEFKSDRKPLPMDDLYKELVAMANTDGGTLFLGIEDDSRVTGLHPSHRDLIEMSAKIQTHTQPSITPILRIEEIDGFPVLIIEVHSSRQLVMTSDGRYLRRRLKHDGSPEMIAMQPHEIIQRLSGIQAFDPSGQIIETVPSSEAINPLERERLRNMIRSYHGDSSLLALSNEELDKALELCRERDGICYPTMTGLLLMGHERFIREYVPGHEVLFQVLDGEDVLFNQSAMRGSLLSIFETVSVQFQSRLSEKELQVGLFRVPIPNYEPDAFREGFVNALVHRDYYRMGTVQIQLNRSHLTISSPGAFPEGVTPHNILTAAPTPRNRILAEAVKRIGLAERTGRGVDKIYRAMLRSGHDIPDYSDSSASGVILRLNSAELDTEFVRMLVTQEKKIGRQMPIDALIMLRILNKERRVSLQELTRVIQRRESDAKETVEWLVETGMVEAIGNGKNRHYMLSSQVYAVTGNEEGYTRQRDMSVDEEKAIIERHLAETGKITRTDVTRLCKCLPNHASYLLGMMAKEQTIEKVSKGNQTYYVNSQPSH